MIDQLGSFIILWQEVLGGICECMFGAFLQAKAIQAETEGSSVAWEWWCVCVCVCVCMCVCVVHRYRWAWVGNVPTRREYLLGDLLMG